MVLKLTKMGTRSVQLATIHLSKNLVTIASSIDVVSSVSIVASVYIVGLVNSAASACAVTSVS